MIDRLSNNILNYLLESEVISNSVDEKEYYKYGIEITISSILNIVLILIIGVVFQSFYESLIFLTLFIILRQFTGGYHAQTYFKCNLYFCISFSLILLLYQLTKTTLDTYMCMLTTITSTSFIALHCPIANKNKPIPKEKRMKFKIISILLSISYGVLGTYLVMVANTLGVIIIYTILLVGLLVFLSTFKEVFCNE